MTSHPFVVNSGPATRITSRGSERRSRVRSSSSGDRSTSTNTVRCFTSSSPLEDYLNESQLLNLPN